MPLREDAVMDDVNRSLRGLIDKWCDRRELGALATLLPAFTANNGLTDGWAAVLGALYNLRSLRSLPDDEQAEIRRLTRTVEQAVHR
jgi:hypothetical protein